VSYVLSLTVSLALLRKYKYIPIVVIVTLIFAFAGTNLAGRYMQIFDVLRKKISIVKVAYAQVPQMASPAVEDRSTSIRLNVEWPRAVRALTKNPLLGTGYSSITLATDNDYLRALGE